MEPWSLSSAVEHLVDIEGVSGSIPLATTISSRIAVGVCTYGRPQLSSPQRFAIGLMLAALMAAGMFGAWITLATIAIALAGISAWRWPADDAYEDHWLVDHPDETEGPTTSRRSL